MITFEQFAEYDYMMYDQYVFRNLLSIYASQKVEYKILLINIFKKQENAPIIVDLNSMSEGVKLDFYEEVYLKETTRYVNFFDNMSLVQNLIKSDLSLDEFADQMSKLLIVEDKYVFRFYDPRIMIHLFLLNYNQYDLKDSILKQWMLGHQSTFKVWDINIWNMHYSLEPSNFSKFKHAQLVSNICIQDFDQYNKDVKQLIGTQQISTASDIVKALQIQIKKKEEHYV